MENKQNWQNYRSMINDHLAIFSVNSEMLDDLDLEKEQEAFFIAQFSIDYEGDEHGLPTIDHHLTLFKNLFRALGQLSALSNCLYAGHTLCNSQAKMYFYVKDLSVFELALQDLEFAHSLEIQPDPYFDTYFEFLMPSSFEKKLNVAEETLDALILRGRNLSDIFNIEHTFYFDDKEELFEFLEEITEQEVSFTTLRYTEEKIVIDDQTKKYMAKIDQEIALDGQDIFNFMELFENLVEEYHGDYAGWVCEQIKFDKSKLN